MSNKGKYIDRTPIICPAGKVYDRKENVRDCLQYYRVTDEIDAVKHDLKIKEKETFPFHPQRSFNTRHQGIFIESKDLLESKPKNRYDTILDDLRETTYHSHWNQQLGSTRDDTGAFPSHIDPETSTFGQPTIRDCDVKELVNPPKGVFEVLLDSQEGHDLYRKSHNDYNPGERVDRGYVKPAYDPDKRYGMNTIYDPKGIWVKCATTWHLNDPLQVANVIQANFAEKKLPKLGKSLSPNKNINNVPTNFRFGTPCVREMCGVQELLKEAACKPCRFKRELYYWIAHLNYLRSYIKRRREAFIDLKDLQDTFIFLDKDKTGWIPLETLYEVCRCHRLSLDRKKLEHLVYLMDILKDGMIEYNEFMTLLDVNKPCPKLMKIKDIKPEHLYYVTTNMAAARDHCTMDNSNIPVAGLSTIRNDIPIPIVPSGQCRADIESLGEETTAKSVINPSIFTNYGLSHRDFFLPRQPEYLRKLFENIGYEFPDDTFDKLWKMGVDLDKTGFVCVDTFKKIIAQALPSPTFKNTDAEETECQ